MKTITFLIIAFFISTCNAQDVSFDISGRAETILVYENKTPSTIFDSLKKFVTAYYGTHKETVTIDSVNKSIHVNGIMSDALKRSQFPERSPNVSSNFKMDIELINHTAKIIIQHIKFTDNIHDYYIDFENLYNNKNNSLTYENELTYINNQFNALINSIDYYIMTGTLKFAFGSNADIDLYNSELLQFDNDGVAKMNLNYDEDALTLYELSINFMHKYFVKPNYEYDSDSKTLTIQSGTFDVFNKRIYSLPHEQYINTSFTIELKFKDSLIEYAMYHKDFKYDRNFKNPEEKPLEISFNDYLKNDVPFNITDEDRRYFSQNYNAFLSAFMYYMDKGEMHL